jgi:hypothetical protein
MKQTISILTLLLITIALLFLNGCDSPSGAKPDPVTKPSLSSPNDNATNVSLTPTFTWTGAADVLEVAINSNFSTIKHSANVSGQSYKMPSGVLEKNSRYYWRAGKKSGNETYWSDDRFTFVTIH